MSSCSRSFGVRALFWALCLTSAFAWADGKKVVGVLDLNPGEGISKEFLGEGSKAIHDLFLKDRRFSGKYTPTTGDTLSSQMLLMGCIDADEACMKSIAGALNAQLLVYGNVAAKGDTFTVSLQLYDSAKEKGARISKPLAKEGIPASRFGKVIAAMAAELFGFPPNGQVQINANIPGAEVLIGGEVKGTTPLVLELVEGSYPIEVRAKGHSSYTQEVTITVGETTEVNIALAPLKEGRGGSPAMMVGGLGMAGAGIALSVLWVSNLGDAGQIAASLANGQNDGEGQGLGLTAQQKLEIREVLGNATPRLCHGDVRKAVNSVSEDAGRKLGGVCLTEPFLVPGLVLIAGGAAIAVLGATGGKGGEGEAVSQKKMLSPYLNPDGAGVVFHLQF